MVENPFLNAIWSLIPTIFAGLVLWLILRAIFRADRTERNEYAKIEAAERAKAGLPPKPSKPQPVAAPVAGDAVSAASVTAVNSSAPATVNPAQNTSSNPQNS